MIDKYTGREIISPTDTLDLKKLQAKINELGDRYFVDRIPNIKQEYAAGVDFLFGNLKWLRKNIIKYVNDETVKTELIRDVDKALSWWSVVFSDDEVPVKLRRSVLALIRRRRNRRVAAANRNAIGRFPKRRP